jgi:BMFP domain-containing protein YqiC
MLLGRIEKLEQRLAALEARTAPPKEEVAALPAAPASASSAADVAGTFIR